MELAIATGATTVAHGCTGKGNDQVRFEVAIAALAPHLKVIAPVREWKWSRKKRLPMPLKKGCRFLPIWITLIRSIKIFWGRACECGVLEDPWATPLEGAYAITQELEDTPDVPTIVEITFDQGIPTALDGETLNLAELIMKMNRLAGEHGIGRIDHIENRLKWGSNLVKSTNVRERWL